MKIVLYSTGCSKCEELKLLLNEYNISYEENNSVEEMLNLGFDEIPVLNVEGNNMAFKIDQNWIIENGKKN